MRLAPFALERYYAGREFKAQYQLSASDCETFSIAELLAWDPDRETGLLGLRLGYTESAGDPSLREEIATLYQNTSAEQILVHSGAEEAIFNFMNVALSPGDHLVVQRPCYQSLSQIAQDIGCEVSYWELEEEAEWQPEISKIERMLRPDTKALVINFPHNPTGAIAPPDFLAQLAQLSQDRGFIVFSDEVYRFLEYDPQAQTPAFCDLDPRAISLGVMSKSFGLPGLRIGWIATQNQQLFTQMAAFKDYTTICNSAPSEFLARLALENRQQILERNRRIVLGNLQMLEDFFDAHHDRFHCAPPQAGPVAFPRLRQGQSAGTLCDELFSKTGVLLLPGQVFGSEYASHFRMGLGRRDFPEALARLDAFLKS
jgi:aspartate/methionine/tyrosine aminotransferase